jgi:hypothetical protein
MKSLQDFFIDAWRWTCKLPPIEVGNHPSFESLQVTEWDSLFEQLMRNRLIMGSFRYELFSDPTPFNYDIVGDNIRRLRLYEEDGNLEHLVDVANLCMKEFHKGRHPKRHFKSSDDGIHVPRSHI